MKCAIAVGLAFIAGATAQAIGQPQCGVPPPERFAGSNWDEPNWDDCRKILPWTQLENSRESTCPPSPDSCIGYSFQYEEDGKVKDFDCSFSLCWAKDVSNWCVSDRSSWFQLNAIVDQCGIPDPAVNGWLFTGDAWWAASSNKDLHMTTLSSGSKSRTAKGKITHLGHGVIRTEYLLDSPPQLRTRATLAQQFQA